MERIYDGACGSSHSDWNYWRRFAPVGSTVFNNYWQETYTVMSHNDDGSITVKWHGDARVSNPSPPRETTHRTPLDDRDKIISLNS